MALWRYPVKSLQGEQLSVADVDDRGLVGDRRWALVDDATGLVLTARRMPGLLGASARLDQSAAAVVVLPDGRETTDDDELSAWLDRPVRLTSAQAGVRGTYETPIDFEHEASSEWLSWQGPEASFHDSTNTQISILSTGSIGDWDTRRFRPNVVVDGQGETSWVGCRVAIGGVIADVVKEIDRCVITTREQPGGIVRDLDVLRSINESGGNLGVGALVVEPGTCAVGQTVTVRGSTEVL